MKRILCALACALLLAACSKTGDGSASGSNPTGTALHPWSHPGELRVGIQRAPNTLNPLLSAFTTEGLVNRLTFDVLVTVDASGKNFVPRLAAEVPTLANGGISNDGLTITYKLRSGVKWHDGVPFTSKDVKFSWSAIMNPNNNVAERVGYDDVKSVDTPDDTTVVFHLKEKFAPFVATVFSESDNPFCIVPEHLLAKYPDINRIPFNDTPIGTGPFKVARWVRGDHIELVANPDYYLGAPKLKSIILKEIPDENTEINALRTHDIDWMFQASPSLANVLKSIPASDVTVHMVDMPQDLDIVLNVKRPQLRDVLVRRAIATAIDKKSLVDRLTGGTAVVAYADQPPFSWAYEPNVDKSAGGTQRAKALLMQAGYTPGPDGIMVKNGQPLSLQISTNAENATRRAAETQVQSMLRAAGVDVQVKNYPGNLFFATYGQGGIQATGKFDLALRGWIAGIDPDDHALYACDQVPPNGANYSLYCTPAMDAAQKAALGTYDQAARKRAYSTIQKLIASDLPEVYLWAPRMLQPTNPDFKHFDPNPINEAWDAYLWEI